MIDKAICSSDVVKKTKQTITKKTNNKNIKETNKKSNQKHPATTTKTNNQQQHQKKKKKKKKRRKKEKEIKSFSFYLGVSDEFYKVITFTLGFMYCMYRISLISVCVNEVQF